MFLKFQRDAFRRGVRQAKLKAAIDVVNGRLPVSLFECAGKRYQYEEDNADLFDAPSQVRFALTFDDFCTELRLFKKGPTSFDAPTHEPLIIKSGRMGTKAMAERIEQALRELGEIEERTGLENAFPVSTESN